MPAVSERNHVVRPVHQHLGHSRVAKGEPRRAADRHVLEEHLHRGISRTLWRQFAQVGPPARHPVRLEQPAHVVRLALRLRQRRLRRAPQHALLGCWLVFYGGGDRLARHDILSTREESWPVRGRGCGPLDWNARRHGRIRARRRRWVWRCLLHFRRCRGCPHARAHERHACVHALRGIMCASSGGGRPCGEVHVQHHAHHEERPEDSPARARHWRRSRLAICFLVLDLCG